MLSLRNMMRTNLPKYRWMLIWMSMAILPLSATAQQIEFKRDIAPILERHCWDCHNAESHEGELRLDTLGGMLEGGGSGIAAIIPGKPEQSYLIDVISHLDPDLKMPPEQEKIPASEIELLRRWIKEGAVMARAAIYRNRHSIRPLGISTNQTFSSAFFQKRGKPN